MPFMVRAFAALTDILSHRHPMVLPDLFVRHLVLLLGDFVNNPENCLLNLLLGNVQIRRSPSYTLNRDELTEKLRSEIFDIPHLSLLLFRENPILLAHGIIGRALIAGWIYRTHT